MMHTVVVDTTQSPFAQLKPLPLSAVKLLPGFWFERVRRNRIVAIPGQFELLESHGVFDNFRRLYGEFDGPRRGLIFSDSDAYKWIEAAALSLQVFEDAHLRNLLKRAITTILPAQRPDGYLNTWFVDERAEQRWTDLPVAHELYCAGHLFQAAVADFRLTGELRLLNPALRFATRIDETFRLAGRPGAPGHPEIEMALVELYRLTGERRWLELARHFLEQRGASHLTKISGHAVRALYFLSGITDTFLETGEAAYWHAAREQWLDFTRHKVYLTGGAGSQHTGEAFGEDYELPESRAYAETCAAIGAIFWHWRMAQSAGDAGYIDWLERTLYNGFLAGVSLSGDHYFYVNPLASSGQAMQDPWYDWRRRPPYQRQPWYDCTCCPPNVQRMLASLTAYFYSTSSEGIWIHLYDNNQLEWRTPGGASLRIHQKTAFPWNGQVEIQVHSATPEDFTLYLRIPGWATSAQLSMNNAAPQAVLPGAYHSIYQRWSDDTIYLELEMPVELITSHPRMPGAGSRVAVMRGPLVYCLEAVDHSNKDVRDLYLPRDATFASQFDPQLLDGVTQLSTTGLRLENSSELPLYMSEGVRSLEFAPAPLNFIPYYAWANRSPGSMTVWLPGI